MKLSYHHTKIHYIIIIINESYIIWKQGCGLPFPVNGDGHDIIMTNNITADEFTPS